MSDKDLRIVRISNATLPVKWRQFAEGCKIVLYVMALYEHFLLERTPEERGAWIAKTVREKLPDVGVLSWNPGKEFELVMRSLSGRPRYAVGAMEEPSDEPDRIDDALGLHALIGMPLSFDTTRFANERDAHIFCAALWHERPAGFRPGISEMPCQGGPDMGVAAECAMLALADLAIRQRLDAYRASDGQVHVLVPAHDPWHAHKELLERVGGHRYPY